MDDGQLLQHLRTIEEQRGVPLELLCTALEEAFTDAYRVRYPAAEVIAKVDRETAATTLHRRWVVVDEVTDPAREIKRSEARAPYQVGDFYDREIAFEDFDRAAALTAKRAIAARVLEFERERVYATYREREGTLVRGLVQREVHGSVYVLLDDRNEAVLPSWERSSRDRHNINDWITCELKSVRKTKSGPALILSRASEHFVRLLVADDRIVRGAREPGWLTMLLATEDYIDVAPARAELAGERIELVWPIQDDPRDTLARALSRWSHDIEWRDDLDLAIVVTEEREAALRVPLAGRLAGIRAIAASTASYHDVVEQLEQEAAARVEPIAETQELEIDPDLIAKLQAFAIEREEALAAAE